MKHPYSYHRGEPWKPDTSIKEARHKSHTVQDSRDTKCPAQINRGKKLTIYGGGGMTWGIGGFF